MERDHMVTLIKSALRYTINNYEDKLKLSDPEYYKKTGYFRLTPKIMAEKMAFERCLELIEERKVLIKSLEGEF